MKHISGLVAGLFLLSMTAIFAGGSAEGKQVLQAENETTVPAILQFNLDNYTSGTIEVDGFTVAYRAYEGVQYVANPVDANYQSFNIYIPEAYFEGETLNGYSADSAPIFLPNGVGGYMPAEPGNLESHFGGSSASAVALSRGMIVASPGARGRTLQTEEGTYYGKAPAAIVDLKAAVRYLKYNDDVMPGNAEMIISNGTSAGGALSALLGSSGDAEGYEQYLAELGAAPGSDAIYAVSAYTPITNLENANAAYEWQFTGLTSYEAMKITMLDYHVQRTTETVEISDEMAKVSDDLASMFPAYVNSLGLVDDDGQALTLDTNGNGSFREYIAEMVLASAQLALSNGEDLSQYSWLSGTGNTVTSIDFDAYIEYLGRSKGPGAFDALDLSSGENDLFGTESEAAGHFTEYAYEHSTVDGVMADAEIVALMNPMNFIGTDEANIASYFRIRFGTMDSDTSIAISAILALSLSQSGVDVNYSLPWNVPHSGDYDLEELFNWIESITR